MLELNAINLNEPPYKVEYFVGTILFSEYPTTMVYSNDANDVIIKEWADCSDDNSIDRYFFYRTSKVDLKKFLEGNITHLQLINNSFEDYVIFQDLTTDEIKGIRLVSKNLIPINYKPKPDFIFDVANGVDILEIYDYYRLDNIDISSFESEVVKKVSFKNNTEAIYVHLNEGPGVGFGAVNPDVFAKSLLNFDKLYKSISLDQQAGKQRGEIFLDAKKNQHYLPFTETLLFEQRVAASYGFFIKPVNTIADIFSNESVGESIVSRVITLISQSKKPETLKEVYSQFSPFTFTAYKLLLEGIKKLHLSIDFNWFNPTNNHYLFSKLDYKDASQILFDIDNLSVVDKQEIKAVGAFRAVNCDTLHYNFTSVKEEQYSGYFDESIKEAIITINFVTVYEIVISRVVTKEAGKRDEKLEDTVVSCYPHSNQ